MLRLCILLLALSGALLAAADVPKFDTAAALETFLFSLEENGIPPAMHAAFRLEKAGALLTAAVKFGPAYATDVAARIPYPEFREPYRDLATYLHLYGPCQKAQAKEQGWWSNYPAPPDVNYCGEVAKLLLANLLWSQIHYCQQLVTGEAKPKVEVTTPGPWRLDEKPVETLWIRADSLYQLADAALRVGLQTALRKRAGPESPDKQRQAILAAAAELEKEKPSRELAALALAKLLVRTFEEVHLHHLKPIALPDTSR